MMRLKKNRIRLIIIWHYFGIILRYILFLPLVGIALLLGFEATAGAGNSSSLYANSKINNVYKLYVLQDPCGQRIPYQANKQYDKKLRVFILDKSKIIMHLPFKNNTYKINVQDNIVIALSTIQNEFGIEYEFVPKEDDANFMVMIETWPESVLKMNALGIGFAKGIPTATNELFLRNKELGLTFGGIILPDENSLKKMVNSLEKFYDFLRSKGIISKDLTPARYITLLLVQSFIHEIGHGLGFLHAESATEKNSFVHRVVIALEDKKQYDSQPPIMHPNMNFFGLLFNWKGTFISSPKEIVPSAQEIDGYRNAQLDSGNVESRANAENSGVVTYKAGAELKCRDNKITFDSD